MVAQRLKRVRKMRKAQQANPSYRWRRRIVLFFMSIAMVALVVRAIDQQIFEKDFLQSEGADRYLDQVSMPAHRGVITDRNGFVLAVSTPVVSVAANPRVLRPNRQVLKAIGGVLDVKPEYLRKRLARYSKRHFVYLKRHVTPDQAEHLKTMIARYDIKGLHLEKEYRRYYPGGEVFSHVIGFTDVDDKGQEGLELAFDKELSGVPGKKLVMRDGKRKVVDDIESINMPAPGKNLALSLDRHLQFLAYRALKKAVLEHHAKAASAVILDAKTGEVLAMVNQPGFNPNGSKSNRKGRLRNRAATDVFEPGSTMKPFTVAVGVDSGLYSSSTLIDTSPGFIKVGQHKVKDHRNLGVIDVETVIRRSSNVGAGKIALSVDKEDLWESLVGLGFGSETGTGYPGESAGQLTLPDNWAKIDQATLSFGYGISVTSLQLAKAYAALANDGKSLPVSLLKLDEVTKGKRVFKSDTAKQLRKMMETVISQEGTAPLAAVKGYRVAGKTGTVKKFGKDGYSDSRYVSLFAGMAPAEDPRLVMVVMVDEPRGEKYYGGAVAAPVFSSVMEDAMRLLNIVPDAVPIAPVKLAGAGGVQ